MPSLGVEKALAHYPHLRRPLDMRAEWYLLIRFSGAQSVANEIIQLYERGFEQGMLAAATLAQNESQEQNL